MHVCVCVYVGECGCLRLYHILLFFWACALERFKVAPVDGRVREQASGEGIHPGLNSAESSEKCLRGFGGAGGWTTRWWWGAGPESELGKVSLAACAFSWFSLRRGLM